MEKEKGGRCITVWLARADLENLQRLAGERGDTVSGLLRAAAQRVETAGASVDLTPILQAQGQALAALEERLAARLDQVAEVAGRTAQAATIQAMKQVQAAIQGQGQSHA
ncbi:MAG TPA: hypothetical protein PKB11_00310 [Desulfovibrio sp.]|uniref:hypothetical protein n=1 Tax=Desulfovibrio sp. TaxID=885 RepID=UPI002BC77880|nr:hypothetical protein [Desulfovibrio sp.]HMM37180.1 hypothetical protein [Desulfovibrio sp.]